MNIKEKIISLFENEKANGKSTRSILLALDLKEYDYQQWKSGRNLPSYEKLAKIARYFNVSTDYLLGLTDNLVSISAPKGWERLDDEQKKQIEIIISHYLGDYEPTPDKIKKEKVAI